MACDSQKTRVRLFTYYGAHKEVAFVLTIYTCNVGIENSLTGTLYLVSNVVGKGQWQTPPPQQIGAQSTATMLLAPLPDQNGCDATLGYALIESASAPDITLYFYSDKNHDNQVTFKYTDLSHAVLFDTGKGALNKVKHSGPLNVTFTLTYKITKIVNRSTYPLKLENGSTLGNGDTIWAPGLAVNNNSYSNFPVLFNGAEAATVPWLDVTVVMDGTFTGDQYLICDSAAGDTILYCL